ncbi:hypothetical protein LTR78_004827 [Recurvomyces mirabilis]|uniref:C2H2-type domain-containing protein n=1 Tax=Recurvomyces mirabilis TaxID=574656 RepID=A0AAE1C249_9PEZI|nr:hypothetical protein LTR78_004827 [Recurvomyces mirabilis]
MSFVPEDEPVFSEEGLQVVRVNFGEEYMSSESPVSDTPTIRQEGNRDIRYQDPGRVILISNLGSNQFELTTYCQNDECPTDIASETSSVTIGFMDTTQEVEALVNRVDAITANSALSQQERQNSAHAVLAAEALRASAPSDEPDTEALENTLHAPTAVRVDSGNTTAQVGDVSKSAPRPRSPLRLQTPGNSSQTAPALPEKDDSIAASPTLCKHVIHPGQGTHDTLPAVQATSPTQGPESATSPITTLPSIHELTGQLGSLAEAAAIHSPRPPPPASHHRTHSFASTTVHSPSAPYHAFTNNMQTSPAAPYAYAGAARSPTSTISDMTQTVYGSPTAAHYSPRAYFAGRRSSVGVADDPAPYSMPPSLPSASSSGESYGHASSGTEGYSTAHTTPIDPASMQDGGNTRTMPIHLPPPNAMAHNPAMMMSFKCDYVGCTAQSFQTQYLLSVPECPRSDGGKGFKRKNEMIRHGLVHNSPGYICPFCADREHRYPRPDNLQRSVIL